MYVCGEEQLWCSSSSEEDSLYGLIKFLLVLLGHDFYN